MSLFGNTTSQAPGGGGLFGSSTAQGGSTGGMFAGSGNQATNVGGGLFGPSTTQANKTNGGLFGAGTAQNNTNTTGGLFGSSAPQSTGGGGLFGANTNQNMAGGGGSLFGSNATQNQGGGAGLFGAANGQNNLGSSLFGTSQNATNTTGQSASASIFGGNPSQAPNSQPQFSSASGAQNQSLQQQVPNLMNSSIYNPPTIAVGNHNLTHAQLQTMQFKGYSTIPNERRLAEQLTTVANKWNPLNAADQPVTTTLRTYLYNAVPKEYAPFFYPNVSAGEDESSWEEALSQKPEIPKVDGQQANIAYVPILCKGFKELGQRVEFQAKSISEMRTRLHEMNNSLTAVMDAHQQRITVNIAASRRQHELLSQRCLRLAVKAQVLRNRGYALDAAEENLRRTLMNLDKQVMDPGFFGREDEIWARMVGLRERVRWLDEQNQRLSAQTEEQSRHSANNANSRVPDDVLAKTRKILKDYDGQLQHLDKELNEVRREHTEWEESLAARRQAPHSVM